MVLRRYFSMFICQGYILKEGDLLKLGRVEYHVIEIRDSKGNIKTIKDVFKADVKTASPLENAGPK